MNTNAPEINESQGHVHSDPVGAKTGMWLFLFTELLLFGGLFIIYTVYRGEYAHGFTEAAGHLNVWLGVTNTVVLLTSSLTMVLGVSALQRNQLGLTQLYLISTILLAATFLLIKFFEWNAKFAHGIYPGSEHLHAMPHGEGIFYNLYFMMTGLHGIHVVIGIVVMVVIYNRVQNGTITRQKQGILEYTGLYWHLVDMIWIFLLPLFYLTN